MYANQGLFLEKTQTNLIDYRYFKAVYQKEMSMLASIFQYNIGLPNGTIVLLAVSAAQRGTFIFKRSV